MTTNLKISLENCFFMTIDAWNKKDVESYGRKDDLELSVLHPELLEMLGEVRDRRIADYGCGEGKLLAELIQKGARISGYDTSDAMIAQSRERLGTNEDLRVIQSGEIPLADNTLDGVVSNLVLMMCPLLEDVKKIFREVNRVLKPNGRWIYCVTHPAFSDREFTTYRNIFGSERNYFDNGEPYRFVLKKQDGVDIAAEHFIDHHYPLSTYLNLLPLTGFNFKELREVPLEGNSLPPYLVVRGDKR